MFGYYLQLGLISLRRNPVLTALMVLGIGLGVGACMTTLTVVYLMGSDPIPWKSHHLHCVQIDNWDTIDAYNSTGDPPHLLAYRDAVALQIAGRADKQAAMYRFGLPVQPLNRRIKPFIATGRATSADFFAMFEPPFKYGSGWDRAQDAQMARVVVLDAKTNEKIFGGGNSVGQMVRFDETEFTVVGVLAEWNLRVKYYDLDSGKLSGPESFYIPFATAIERKFGFSKALAEKSIASEDTRFVLWVELDSPADLAAYRAFLNDYVAEQKKLGRLARPRNNRLYNVVELMKKRHVVSGDIEAQAGLSLAFLVVCLLNAVGLMLAKFLRKSGEVGVRRALGASRKQVFVQHVIEAGMVGLVGGLLGLAFTAAGLWIVRQLYSDYANVASLDWTMMLATLVLSLVASVLAGWYPTWRACRIEPAIQIKMQ